MAKKWMALLLSLSLLVSACATNLYQNRYCTAEWEFDINAEAVAQVKEDLARAKLYRCNKLKITLTSPGGYILNGIQIIRAMQEARQDGLILEVHGQVLVASMATIILAMGTPGYRYVSWYTLTLIHPPARNGMCIRRDLNPTTEDAKVDNAMIDLLTRFMVELTSKSKTEVDGWMKCGNEQASDGRLLVELGFADYLE